MVVAFQKGVIHDISESSIQLSSNDSMGWLKELIVYTLEDAGLVKGQNGTLKIQPLLQVASSKVSALDPVMVSFWEIKSLWMASASGPFSDRIRIQRIEWSAEATFVQESSRLIPHINKFLLIFDWFQDREESDWPSCDTVERIEREVGKHYVTNCNHWDDFAPEGHSAGTSQGTNRLKLCLDWMAALQKLLHTLYNPEAFPPGIPGGLLDDLTHSRLWGYQGVKSRPNYLPQLFHSASSCTSELAALSTVVYLVAGFP